MNKIKTPRKEFAMTSIYDATFKPMLVSSILAFAFILSLAGVSYGQSFGGAFEGMSNSKDPVQIEADRLEVADGQGIAIFDGNVAVTQGSTLLKAKKLKVHYLRDAKTDDPGGNVRKIEATGKVAVRSGDQMATADSAVVDMQEQIATLSGNVTVSQGENILVGCKLRINMATNAANLTPCDKGRVQMVFKPKSN
ncbi:MAG: lipopolysaccharide transport periplasmic protein LptA [Salaquimonas sp.]